MNIVWIRRGARALCCAPLAIVATLAAAQDNGAATEQVIVVGQRVYPVVDTVAPSTEEAVDTAELLRQLPGSNLNANGMLSGIAQYRGLYGDRVAVSIDGLRTVTGGPNAMDAPLSYASPLLLDRLSLERGITSVANATESLGGHVSVDFDRGDFGDRPSFAFAGKAQARYGSNGAVATTALQLVEASDTHKVALLGQRDRADDLDYPGGTLTPTQLERDRYDLSYAYRNDAEQFLIYAGRLETSDTGTPALPMDILSIDTNLGGLRFSREIGADSSLDVAVSHSDVDHVMANFGLRTPPASPASYRSNHAVGSGYQWRIGGRTAAAGADWRFGLDGETAEHTATITNPNVPPFRVENFNGAERNLVGLYGQWNRSQGAFDLEGGLRVNSVETKSGPVSATIPAMNAMMQMMATNAGLLADAFNAADLERSHTNVDAVFKIGRVLGADRNVYLEVGRKTRAPSYQELYLWLPLESTGGLADGRSYIGNPALESEVSRELNVGTNWRTDTVWLAPQIFYKDISGYIQGVPSTNMVANMVSNMMSGSAALEFANTDAEIYGLDLAWGYYLSDSLLLDGVVTYVRGKRTDVRDNLYRLAPLNGRIALTYEARQWSARVEALAYARQTKVAAFNDETPTAGYGLLNAGGEWRFGDGLKLSASVSNLLDKRYQDHLDGFNRVANVDVPVGERLYGAGRSIHVGVNFTW